MVGSDKVSDTLYLGLGKHLNIIQNNSTMAIFGNCQTLLVCLTKSSGFNCVCEVKSKPLDIGWKQCRISLNGIFRYGNCGYFQDDIFVR